MGDLEKRKLGFDIKSISKGDIIEVPILERRLGCKYQVEVGGEKVFNSKYAFSLMSYKSMLDKEFIECGRHLTTRMDHGSIRICFDTEAASYNAHQQDASLSRFKRAQVRNQHVDASNLDDDVKAMHLKNLLNAGRILQAITREENALALESKDNNDDRKLSS